MRKTLPNKTGFTIVELLIGIALSSLLALAIINLFSSQQRTYSVQDQVAEAQQTARNAIDLLTREIRSAGNGVPNTYLTSNYTGGTTLTVASASGFSTGDIINITDFDNNSEAATVSSAAGTTITISSSLSNTYPKRSLISLEKISLATENSITFSSDITISGTILTSNYTSGIDLLVATNKGFSNGDTIYINDGSKWETATVNNILYGNTIRLSSALTNIYPAGSRVNRLDTVAYSMNGNTLERSINNGSSQPVAENIDYLELRYYDKDDVILANPSPYTGVNLNASQRSRIRRIKVQIVARTAQEDPNWTESGSYANGNTYNDGYRRILLESDIKLRNLGY
jgi:type IV pilus assembly protein PilW